jgi:hypothetical protein
MSSCKPILILLCGMILGFAILIGKDIYDRTVNEICFASDMQSLNELQMEIKK